MRLVSHWNSAQRTLRSFESLIESAPHMPVQPHIAAHVQRARRHIRSVPLLRLSLLSSYLLSCVWVDSGAESAGSFELHTRTVAGARGRCGFESRTLRLITFGSALFPGRAFVRGLQSIFCSSSHSHRRSAHWCGQTQGAQVVTV